MWEYKTVYFGAHELAIYNLSKYLNNEGKERWELVHLIIGKMINNPNETSNYTFIFKRSVKKSKK